MSTPVERTVGYGVTYDNHHLVVHCGTCKAPIGTPCSKRGGGTHTTRQDKARNHFLRATHKLFHRLENEALNRDPNGPLWSFQPVGHLCGVKGAHVLSECVTPGGS